MRQSLHKFGRSLPSSKCQCSGRRCHFLLTQKSDVNNIGTFLYSRTLRKVRSISIVALLANWRITNNAFQMPIGRTDEPWQSASSPKPIAYHHACDGRGLNAAILWSVWYRAQVYNMNTTRCWFPVGSDTEVGRLWTDLSKQSYLQIYLRYLACHFVMALSSFYKQRAVGIYGQYKITAKSSRKRLRRACRRQSKIGSGTQQ